MIAPLAGHPRARLTEIQRKERRDAKAILREATATLHSPTATGRSCGIHPYNDVRPFGKLVTHGAFYTAGVQLSNVSVVLPFICAQRGSVWTAGLLYPAFTVGSIVGNSLSPVILNWSRQLRHLVVAAASTAMATLVGCNAAASSNVALLSSVFLATSAAIGIIAGITSIAFADVVAAKLPAAQRGEAFLMQGAAGSTLATIMTLLVVPVLAHGDLTSRQVHLLWLGAAGLAAAGVAAAFVGPVAGSYAIERRPVRDTYRQGLIAARSQPWFRRYAFTQLLFVPSNFGATFYSLRAAQHRGDLPALVIISSIGLVIGSLAWRVVYRNYGVRGMLTVSSVLSSSAAVVCMTAEIYPMLFGAWAYGIVLLLATVASQAVFVATMSWISVFASHQDRPVLTGFGSITVAVASSMVGAVLGAIAVNHTTVWPVVIVLVLNLTAGVAAIRAPARQANGPDSIPVGAARQPAAAIPTPRVVPAGIEPATFRV